MALEKKKALFLGPVESTYGVDPDPTGAAHLWVPATDLGPRRPAKQVLETNYFTGRNWPTAPLPGPDGGEITCTFPAIGLSTAAGVGTNASTVTADWYDRILLHVWGALATTAGIGVGTGSTASSLVVDTDVYSLNDVVGVYHTSAARLQWAAITADAGTGTYTIAPNFETTPTTDFIAYGAKIYTATDNGGATLSGVYRQDGLDFNLLGLRATSFSISAEAGKLVQISVTFRYDSSASITKGSLPTPGIAPAVNPIRYTSSPFFFAGTQYQTRSIELNINLTTAPLESSAGANARGGDENIAMAPTITIHPHFENDLETLWGSVSTGRLVAQFGGGVLAGGVINSNVFAAEHAAITSATPEGEQGRLRQSVSFGCYDPGAPGRVVQFARM